MEKTNDKTRQISVLERFSKLQIMSALAGRLDFFNKFGWDDYNGARNLFNALGYPQIIRYKDYHNRYARQEIAKAIIDKPVKATWQGQGWNVQEILEKEGNEKTQFELAVNELKKQFKLRSVFIRLDKMVGLGKYAVLLLGTNDLTKQDSWSKPIQKSKNLKLTFIKPYDESSAIVNKTITDPKDPRFGLPLNYLIGGKDIPVHWTRVIHVVDEVLENELEGIPRLKAVYNRLMDIEKISGGDAEMFWRGARPGYTGNVDKEYQLTDKMIDDLEKQLDEYEHNLRRFLVNEGIQYKALAQQVADPSNHIDIQLQLISAETGIPKRILVGSERAKLASTQDTQEWKELIQNRRNTYATEMILRPFLDRLIMFGIIPKPKNGYEVVWEDLFSLSEKDRVEIGSQRATALKNYTSQPMSEGIVSPDAFLKFFLGLSEEQLSQITQMQGTGLQSPPNIQE